MSNLRMCNNDDSGKQTNHYWDKSTGKRVTQNDVRGELGARDVFVPEELCPRHREAMLRARARAERRRERRGRDGA